MVYKFKVLASIALIGVTTISPLFLARSIAKQAKTKEATESIHDFSGESWSDAFAHLTQVMAHEYPYTDWKRLDWDTLYQQFERKVADAERRGDSKAYYVALRQFLFCIPDSHVRIRGGEFQDLPATLISATYGFNVDQLADGALVVTQVLPESSAQKSGLKTGDRIIRWNGRTPDLALARVPLWLNDKPPATDEAREAVRLRLLPRALPGAILKLRLLGPHGGSVQGMRWTAALDQGRLLSATTIYASVDEQRTPVLFRVLDGDIGYIKLVAEPSPQFGRTDEEISKFLSETSQIHGIILDLRHHIGGDDATSMRIVGLFCNRPEYAYRSLAFDGGSGKFLPVEGEEYHVIPSRSFDLKVPVIILVSPGTISAGETIAWACQRFGVAKVLGFRGSAGAFGGTGGQAKMPTGLTAYYPTARTVDENGKILVEGDASGHGGVRPDLQLLKNSQSVAELARGKMWKCQLP